MVLKLIDRGQYSKNENLSETVAAATSVLSYVDPSSVLPFLASRFHMALETVSTVPCIGLLAEIFKIEYYSNEFSIHSDHWFNLESDDMIRRLKTFIPF